MSKILTPEEKERIRQARKRNRVLVASSDRLSSIGSTSREAAKVSFPTGKEQCSLVKPTSEEPKQLETTPEIGAPISEILGPTSETNLEPEATATKLIPPVPDNLETPSTPLSKEIQTQPQPNIPTITPKPVDPPKIDTKSELPKLPKPKIITTTRSTFHLSHFSQFLQVLWPLLFSLLVFLRPDLGLPNFLIFLVVHCLVTPASAPSQGLFLFLHIT